MDEQPKKIGRRRRALGGSRAATEAYDGVRATEDSRYDEEDRAEDDSLEDGDHGSPADVNAQVAQLPEEPEFTPKGRMQEVTTRASAYEREYRLKMLHRMIMRGVPIDKIADELGLSVNTVIKDRSELYARLKEQAANLDVNELIGNTLGFYNEVQGMALRTASSAKVPMNIRLSAIRTALGAKNDSHRFLQAAGVFDVLSFKAGQDASQSDIEKLVGMTEKLLEEEDLVESMAKEKGFDLDAVQEELEEQELSNSLRYF